MNTSAVFITQRVRFMSIPQKRRNNRQSIKRKLTLSIVFMALAITILSGMALSLILYNSNTENMEERVQESALAYNRAVSNAINAYKVKIEAQAQNTTITDESMSVDEIMAYMDIVEEANDFIDMNLANQDGITLNDIDVSSREYFQKAMAGETYISSPLVSKLDGSLQMIMGAKINNGSGYEGVVFSLIDSNTFSQMIDDVSIGMSGFGFIVDKYGVIIADKNRENVANFVNYVTMAEEDESYAEMAVLTEQMIAGKSGIMEVTLDGQSLKVGYSPIPDTDGWSIAVCAVEKEMMSSFYDAILLTLGLIVLFIILSVFVGIKIANPIASPIVSLVNRIELLSEGDLHTAVPQIKNKDELGVLSEAFTKTVDTLKGYISEISKVLGSIASGNITVESEQDYCGDFIPIKTALSTIVLKLNELFGSVLLSVDQVATGAEQVSSTAQSMAQGATEQAATVEELSATMAEIAVDIERNAEHSAKANDLSQKAYEEIEIGNQKMQKMVSSMSEISNFSSQIGAIIKTIEDIAFQTNILALNASVEAARAGMHGKGFAVVAEEVKNLATKSAEAAKNTNVLINSSITAVDEGTQIANETAQKLSVIIDAAKETSELINKISEASGTQATAVEQVNEGINQISSVVQANSAASEENAATSEELNSQAQIVKQMLKDLKLK